MWVVLILLCFAPEAAAQGAARGLRAAMTAVVPSLLPMMLVCRLLLSGQNRLALPEGLSRRLFGVSGAVTGALVAGFLGGYPLGAGAVATLYKANRLTKEEAERALGFCNNSGPAFFLGVVAGIFGAREGRVLYAIHVFSALICGILTAQRDSLPLHSSAQGAQTPPFSRRFSEAVRSTAQALLTIAVLIAFFFALRAALEALGFGRLLETIPLPQGLLWGILELSGGILLLSTGAQGFVCAAFLLGWGGLCVQMQSAALAADAGLSTRGCVPRKALHGLVSALLAAAWTRGTVHFALSAALLALCAALRAALPLPTSAARKARTM